ncbi:hypothetical protein N8273_01400, partial [Algibacter sp.]|nr:hypothetical protein [Algibacter sp.]
MFRYLIVLFLILLTDFSFGQTVMIQTHSDAIIDLDRKDFLGTGIPSDHSDGYAHDFTLPARTNPCQQITDISVEISLTNYTYTGPCPHYETYFNLFYGCTSYAGGATCLPATNLLAEPNYPPNTSPPVFNFGNPLGSPLNPTIVPDFGDNLSVDIIPRSDALCNAVVNRDISYEYTITVTVTVTDIPPAQPPVVDCWDNYVFNTTTCVWDNTGTPPVQPPVVDCWDNYVFNTATCVWDNTGTPPVQPPVVDCWDNYVFNTATCVWDNTGTQDLQPPIVNVWDNFVFNPTTCLWENTGLPLGFCSGNSGDPIFTEDFGTGDGFNALPGGTTTYNYVNELPNDGEYTVRNGIAVNGFKWHETEDHTQLDTFGKCLIVNAAAAAGEFYQSTITGLCPNTTYEFSAWVINLVIANSFCSTQPGGTIPINVAFEIRNSADTVTLASGNTGNVVETPTPIWNQYGLVFNTGTETSVILKVINNGAGGCGNDLAIDDIVFKSCGDFAIVTDASSNTSVTLCSSQAPYTPILTVNPDGSVYSTYFYQWQDSTDGINWNDIAGETNQSTATISTSVTTFYRAKIGESLASLANDLCLSFSDEYLVTINQAPPMPVIECWETATINDSTCTWEVTGTPPLEPTDALECWE